jgi:AcrR family transcriptional regulator
MSVHSAQSTTRTAPRGRPAPRSLLDVAAEVLVANPAAPLAVVAQAAGIGRTTLHKQYATRDDLLLAVAHRSLDLCIQAARDAVADENGALRRLVDALIPVGPQLAFLFRQPSLDADPALDRRFDDLDEPVSRAVRAAQQAGELRRDRPEWWFVSSLYALVYVAWEGIAKGRLAPLDATELVLGTLLDGLGAGRE